jgi:hypothetical protein
VNNVVYRWRPVGADVYLTTADGARGLARIIKTSGLITLELTVSTFVHDFWKASLKHFSMRSTTRCTWGSWSHALSPRLFSNLAATWTKCPLAIKNSGRLSTHSPVLHTRILLPNLGLFAPLPFPLYYTPL